MPFEIGVSDRIPDNGGKMFIRDVLSALMAVLVMTSTAAASRTITEKRVTVAPGLELRTIEVGAWGKRPTIVFIPGWSAGADIWRGQIERFKNTHRIISFDPRSQGQSTKTLDGNTPEQRAIDLHALLAKERADRPVLVAWSQAVQDVAAYAAKYGTRDVSGIVLVDAAISDGANAIAERPQETASQFRQFGIYLASQQAYLRGMFAAIVSKPQAPGLIDQAVATAMKTPPSIGMSMLVADMFTIDRRAALASMGCPVLIIASGNSSELSVQKAEAETIRGARFVQIDDAAHAVFLDQPNRFAAELADFSKRER